MCGQLTDGGRFEPSSGAKSFVVGYYLTRALGVAFWFLVLSCVAFLICLALWLEHKRCEWIADRIIERMEERGVEIRETSVGRKESSTAP